MESEKFSQSVEKVKNYYSNPEVIRAYDQAVTKNCYALDGAKSDDEVLRFAGKVHDDVVNNLSPEIRRQADEIKALNLSEMTYSQAGEIGKALEPGMTPIANAVKRCNGRDI